jgi:hypothetical protein
LTYDAIYQIQNLWLSLVDVTNARQIIMLDVEFNLDPHNQHIYKKEMNVWHIQIYKLNFWESAHFDKKYFTIMIKFLTSHWKHEIKLTCTFEDNLTLKNETLEGHI